MKKLFIFLVAALLLLSGCRPQEQQNEAVLSSGEGTQSVVESQSPSDDTAQQDQQSPVQTSRLEGVVLKAEDNRVLLQTDKLPVSDKIYVLIDEKTARPLPELKSGYRVRVEYSGAIDADVLPEIKADALYFLEDMQGIPSYFGDYFPNEEIPTPQNTQYPSKKIKEYARSYREVYLGGKEEKHLTHIESHEEFTKLWSRLESGTYDGYGAAVDYSELVTDYTPSFFKENDLLIVYVYASNGGPCHTLYDIVVEQERMTVQLLRTDLPKGCATTDMAEERLILIQVPEQTTRGITDTKLQLVYGDETSVVFKDNGRIVVDADKFSIQKENELLGVNAYYCSFETAQVDSLQVDDRVMIVHTGNWHEGEIATGNVLEVIKEEAK